MWENPYFVVQDIINGSPLHIKSMVNSLQQRNEIKIVLFWPNIADEQPQGLDFNARGASVGHEMGVGARNFARRAELIIDRP